MKNESIILWLWSKFSVSCESNPNRSFRLLSLLEVKPKRNACRIFFCSSVKQAGVGLSIPKILAISRKYENVV